MQVFDREDAKTRMETPVAAGRLSCVSRHSSPNDGGSSPKGDCGFPKHCLPRLPSIARRATAGARRRSWRGRFITTEDTETQSVLSADPTDGRRWVGRIFNREKAQKTQPAFADLSSVALAKEEGYGGQESNLEGRGPPRPRI